MENKSKFNKFYVLFFILIFGVLFTSVAQAKIEVTLTLEGTTKDTLPSHAMDVYISGNYAYVADFTNGLVIVDISDPTNPITVGNHASRIGRSGQTAAAIGVAVSGNYAYIANWYDDLYIIDVTDSTNPTLAATYNTGDGADQVTISGNYAYISSQWDGVDIVDISDPTNPRFVGNYNTDDLAEDVAISGNYAYIADRFDGVIIIDISDPANPTFVGSLDTQGDANTIVVSGNYGYVADESNGLVIIDISNPANPRMVGHYDTAGAVWGVALSGNYAYVGDGTNGVVVLNVSNPTNPMFAGSYDTEGYAGSVAVVGSHVYVADSDTGLVILKIEAQKTPTEISTIIKATGSYNISLERFSFTQDPSGNLHVVFVENTDDTHGILHYAKSKDGGITWQINDLQTVYGSPEYAMLAIDQNGKAYIAYHDVDYSVQGSHKRDLYAYTNVSGSWSRYLIKSAWNYWGGYGYVQRYDPVDIIVDKNNIAHLYARQSGWWAYGGDIWEYTFQNGSWSGPVDTGIGGGVDVDGSNSESFHVNLKTNGDYYAVWADALRHEYYHSPRKIFQPYILYGTRSSASLTGTFSQHTGRSDALRRVVSALDGKDNVYALYNKWVGGTNYLIYPKELNWTTLVVSNNWGNSTEIASTLQGQQLQPRGVTVTTDSTVYLLWSHYNGSKWDASYYSYQEANVNWHAPIIAGSGLSATVRNSYFNTPSAFMYVYIDSQNTSDQKLVFKRFGVTPTPNQPPIASFTYLPENPSVNQEITFDASSSSDPDGEIVKYEWDFGDEKKGEGKIVKHSYSKEGSYTVTLTVTDNEGAYAEKSLEVKVTKLPKFLTLPYLDPNIKIQQGWRYNAPIGPNPEDPYAHNGIDYIKGEVDITPWESFEVVASADGVAMYSEGGGYGTFVLIRHDEKDNEGNNYFTLYSHLDRVSSGIVYRSNRWDTNYDTWTPVKRGDIIGKAGATGVTDKTWIHLHFEVQRGGYAQKKTDPYDIYKTRDYYTGCGENYLWTTCPPSLPSPPTPKFNIGDTIQTTDNVNVRTGPGTNYLEIEDPEYKGYAPKYSIGVIIGGPETSGSYVWWKVSYEAGYTGWSAQNWLENFDKNEKDPFNYQGTYVIDEEKLSENNEKNALPYVQKYAIEKEISPALLMALIKQESNFNPSAIGDAGKAIGYMQLHWDAAYDAGYRSSRDTFDDYTTDSKKLAEEDWQKDGLDQDTNIRYGSGYLRIVYEQYKSSEVYKDPLKNAISAYHNGRTKGPQKSDEDSYVKPVIQYYEKDYLPKSKVNLPKIETTILIFKSPINVTVIDQYNRIISDNGTNNIPNASMILTNKTKIFYVPENLNYSIEIKAYDTGTFNFTSISPIGNNINIVNFENISISTTTKAEFEIKMNVTNYTISIDYDGDGFYEKEKSPDLRESVNINLPPYPYFTCSPENPEVNQTITFNASLAYDQDGNITLYKWDFGDGNTKEGVIVTHSYSKSGNYTITLTVTDNENATNSITYSLNIKTIKGDFNGNGRVDIGDATMVAYMVVGKVPVNMDADFNNNGRVDIGDAAKIAYYVVGKIDSL